MGKTTFSGPVVSLAGFNPNGYANIVTLGDSGGTEAVSLTAADHGGRILSTRLDHTLTCTLPAINGTDPVDETSPGQVSNYGLTFRIMISYTIVNLTINTASADDDFFGAITINTEAVNGATESATFFADDTDVGIAIVSDNTGYLPGGMVELTATNQGWLCNGTKLLSAGTPSTPFI